MLALRHVRARDSVACFPLLASACFQLDPLPMTILHRSLELTSMVCERGSALQQFKHIVFNNGLVYAFNGLVHLQAKSGLEHEEPFAVNYDRLASALRSVQGDDFSVKLTGDFLVMKRGKLTVRVRRVSAEEIYFSPIKPPPRSERIAATGFLQALSAVSPFVSADASRPWSVSALIRGGYVWATNNLSLVRFPMPGWKQELRVPAQAIPLLLELKEVDWIAPIGGQLTVGCGEAMLSFPEASGDWPSLEPFFATMPKKLPEADEELADAAKTTEKFSERFVTLNDESIEGKLATIESEYQLDLKKGKGVYNAQLFSLVASHATHIDFSSYPKPVFFRAKEMEGVMIGVAPGAQQ